MILLGVESRSDEAIDLAHSPYVNESLTSDELYSSYVKGKLSQHPDGSPLVYGQGNIMLFFLLLSSFDNSPLQSFHLQGTYLNPILSDPEFENFLLRHQSTLTYLYIDTEDSSPDGWVNRLLELSCQAKNIKLTFKGRLNPLDPPIQSLEDRVMELVKSVQKKAERLADGHNMTALDSLMGSLNMIVSERTIDVDMEMEEEEEVVA